MAYGALVSLAQTIEQIQNNDHYSLSPCIKQQIMSVDNYVTMLQNFFEKFPEKVSSLESRIMDVTNEAEDVIEHFMWEQSWSLHQSISRADGPAKLELKQVTKEIDSLAEQVMEIMHSPTSEDAHITDHLAACPSSSGVIHEKDAIVGFDDDMLAIKERLCGESSKLQVLPIVGMGGIGKTTLARKAYNDPLIVEHFHIRASVSVSQDYKSERILSSLLNSIKEFNIVRSAQSDEEKLYRTLKGMRYLILLDDMWSAEDWDDLRRIFPDDHNGSRIILTTRLSDMAAYAVGPSRHHLIHDIHFMDEDQSWVLLQKKVFKEKKCPRGLEYTGRRIAKSCGGLPLAIVVIGGILSTVSKAQSSWLEIENNVNNMVAADGGVLQRILSLSYTHLPHHLRPCFLYMAVFPEDYEIRVSNLIKLWVAEGFLKCANGSKSFEDVAEECLLDLVKRSLVLVHKRKSNGNIKSCGVHDLVRDLCIKTAKENKFFEHVTDWNKRDGVLLDGIKKLRRVSISHKRDLNSLEASIRTIISLKESYYLVNNSFRCFEDFKLLRIFHAIYGNLMNNELLEVHDPIFELFRLRYLSMRCLTKKIPASISNLQNLQTLVIYGSEYPEVFLPLGIWRMPQLRHMVSVSCRVILPNPVRSAPALENLQTLVTAENLVCRERTMKLIQNVKRLQFYYNYYDDQDCYLENLVILHKLESLELTILSLRKFSPVFPAALRKLTLVFSEGCWDCIKLIGQLPNLEVLKLKGFSFHGGKWETVEGEFQQLKFLLIRGSNLKEWISESSHFPSLKCLLIHENRYLKEIPDDFGEIPTLELIEVKRCLRSLEESAKWIQEEQEDFGNDAFQVRFDKNIDDGDGDGEEDEDGEFIPQVR